MRIWSLDLGCWHHWCRLKKPTKKKCNKKEQKLVKSSPAKWRGWKRSVNKISTSNYIVKIKIYKDTIVASWCRAYVLLQGTPKRRVWVLDKHHQWVHWLAKLRQTVLHLAARYLWRKICYWPKQFFFLKIRCHHPSKLAMEINRNREIQKGHPLGKGKNHPNFSGVSQPLVDLGVLGWNFHPTTIRYIVNQNSEVGRSQIFGTGPISSQGALLKFEKTKPAHFFWQITKGVTAWHGTKSPKTPICFF